jgi:tRNA-specific 2-thiouridylase
MKSVTKGKKVYVGMSGGVDSSVSAALLKKAGYDVTGVFIKVWQPKWFECTWREDRLDAMRVAAKLDIPFVTLDLESEYKKEVVDYMIAEYKAGRTPNPDVMCNKYVKFGGFYKWAMAQGADYVATGHYARSTSVKSRKERVVGDTKDDGLSTFDCRLLTGSDVNKDQSYFLWTLTADQLAHTLFPIGDMEKPVVRKYAERFELATAFKKDSQGLCFIGKVDIKDFLKRYIEPKSGDVLSTEGRVIGFHDGATFFTIGERHGFVITKKGTQDEAYYVVAKDMEQNTITVSPISQIKQYGSAVSQVNLSKVNIISPSEVKLNHQYTARARYRQELFGCKIKDFSGSTLQIEFDTPQESISPGQSLVLYAGDVCLGGGIIE